MQGRAGQGRAYRPPCPMMFCSALAAAARLQGLLPPAGHEWNRSGGIREGKDDGEGEGEGFGARSPVATYWSFESVEASKALPPMPRRRLGRQVASTALNLNVRSAFKSKISPSTKEPKPESRGVGRVESR